MRLVVEQKLEKIHDGIYRAHNGLFQLMTMVMSAAHYINYLIEQGDILEAERDACFRYIADKVFYKYNCPVKGANDGWVLFMGDLNGKYDRERVDKYKPYIENM
jgi:hypothetical protein